MRLNRRIERNDVMEGQRPVLQVLVQHFPALKPRLGAMHCHHADGAAAEVAPRGEELARVLAHNQPAEVREAEDLVEGEGREVRGGGGVGEDAVKRRRGGERGGVEERVGVVVGEMGGVAKLAGPMQGQAAACHVGLAWVSEEA